LFQAIPKLALGAQTVGIAFLSLRQDLWTKNVSMSAQKDFLLGNSSLSFAPHNSQIVFLSAHAV
jgi:hypothetical protein